MTITAYVDVAFITGPLTAAEVYFESIGQPVPVAARNELISAVAARAAKA